MIEDLVNRILAMDKDARVYVDEIMTASMMGTYQLDVANLKTIAKAYDDNVLAPQRFEKRVKANIEWLKSLPLNPRTNAPKCGCGDSIPLDHLQPVNRDSLLAWCELHSECVEIPDVTFLVKPCPHRDVLNSECVLPLDHEGDHQMVNGTNEANYPVIEGPVTFKNVETLLPRRYYSVSYLAQGKDGFHYGDRSVTSSGHPSREQVAEAIAKIIGGQSENIVILSLREMTKEEHKAWNAGSL